MLKKIKNRRNELLFTFCSLLIFIFHIWYIRDVNTLVIRNDEYGYWTHAALLTGHDWSDVFASHMNWYSYGYSLVLVPLFWLSHNMHIMYKAAILLNGSFGILTYLACYRCARILFPKAERWLLTIVSFMVCMYSSYLTQSHIAWSETFLYLMVWLLLYAFLLFEQAPSVSRGLVLSTLMGCCYITHNRTIGIVCAYFLLVLFMQLAGGINGKQFVALLAPLLFILFINVNIKTWLCLAEGFGLKPKNGLGGQKGHFLSLLTRKGWENLFRALCGQLWGLFSSTFGLVYWGIVRCMANLYRAFRSKKQYPHVFFYLFVLLAATGTFLVSAISLIDPSEITWLDHNTDLSYFIYTRYDECIVGILLLTGFMELSGHRIRLRSLWLFLTEAGLYLMMCVVLHFNLARIEGTWHYRPFCAAGIGFYRLVSETFSMEWCSLLAGIITLLVTVLALSKHYRHIPAIAACLLLTAVFIPTGLYSSRIGAIASQRGKVSCGNIAMYDKLRGVISRQEVYCTLENTSNYRIAYELQVNLIDTPVYSVTLEDLPLQEEDYFICCSNGDLDYLKGDDFYLLAQSNSYAVVVKGKALMQKAALLTGEELPQLLQLQEPRY